MLTLQNDSPDIDSVATVNNQYLNYGHKFRKFTKACLMKDPGQRLSARELLSHTYIKSKAKDRELLCRVLLGGEMPPPISRINKHPDDRSEKRDPKNNSTEWNFDTVGRVSNSGVDSDDDSDENDYKVTSYTDRSGSVLQPCNSSSGFDFPSELLTQTNATAVIGSSASNQVSNARATGATMAMPTALPVVDETVGGISPRSNIPHLDRTDNYNIAVSGSSSSSFPPAPACTPASPETSNSISAMAAAFSSTLTTEDSDNQQQQSQTNDPVSLCRSS
ncbi:unnamed protein product [Schistosoma mattheei]|uniref:Protein kinase domain-containing protein n=1 Tax=Schistosoma mattheei TaxID=31246 RepID=A0A183Q1I2_9TREM|nr:unnamed protein product [Schistosoma mattheei]